MTKKHDIIWLDSIDSTNEEARRRISDIDNLSVLSAVEQRSGRGQRGNTWSSEPGENLLFSIVLKYGQDAGTLPPLLACDQFLISEITALSVIDFLETHGIEAEIKWPNDIYVADSKICGILIENSVRGRHISSSIIGIGLNVNQKNFDVKLVNPTSMHLCSDKNIHYDVRGCLKTFMDIFTSRLVLPESGDERNSVRQEYLGKLWRKDKPSRFIDYTMLPSGHLDRPTDIKKDISYDSGRKFTGIIRDISDIGNIMIEDSDSGKIREFGFKEVGYIL